MFRRGGISSSNLKRQRGHLGKVRSEANVQRIVLSASNDVITRMVREIRCNNFGVLSSIIL